jgi:hypothetical protein
MSCKTCTEIRRRAKARARQYAAAAADGIMRANARRKKRVSINKVVM